MAKPKPMNLNLASFRKVHSQEARDPNSPGNQSLDQHGVSARSWKQTARTTNENPTMYSQEKQQSDAQTSNTGKQGRRDEYFKLSPQLETDCEEEEVNQFGRRKLEFHNMQISDSRYLENVYKNLKKKVTLAEDTTSLGIESWKTNTLIWGMLTSNNNEGRHSYGTKLH